MEAAIDTPAESLGPIERKCSIEVEVRKDCDLDYWNEQVRAYQQGCFYDTTMRHEAFLRMHPDAQPFYMTAYKNGREVGWLGFLETYLGHDILTWQKRWRPFRFIPKYVLKTFDAFTLPMVHDPSLDAEVITAFVDALDDLARRRGIYKLTHFKYPAPGRAPAQNELFFTTRSFEVLRHGTYLINLTPGLDELWAKIKSEARTAVRKAGKQGIVVRPGGSEEDIARYYEILVQNRKRDAKNKMPRPMYSQESIADHVRYFIERDIQTLFCAEIDGRIESCTLVKYYNGIATFNSHARTDMCYERNLRDGDLLCWEMVKWAKERGLRYFDMTGFDAEPRNDRQRGIRRFKSKWGGECVYYNYYAKVYGLGRDRLVSLLRKVVS